MKPLKPSKLWTPIALIGLVVMALTYGACKKEPPEPPPVTTEPCDTMTVSYTNDIIFIITTYCSAPSLGDCHDGTNPDAPGLGNYAGLKAVIDDGRFEDKVFVTREMPDPATNGPTQLDPYHELLLKCWIKAGAPNN